MFVNRAADTVDPNKEFYVSGNKHDSPVVKGNPGRASGMLYYKLVDLDGIARGCVAVHSTCPKI